MSSLERPPFSEPPAPAEQLKRAPLPPIDVAEPTEAQLDTHRRYIEGMRAFAVGRWTPSGVPQDTVNVWSANHAAVEAPEFHYVMEPVPTFEEHARTVWAHDPEVVEYLLKESNAKTVAKLDGLATTFNTALNRYREDAVDTNALHIMQNAAKEAINAIRGITS